MAQASSKHFRWLIGVLVALLLVLLVSWIKPAKPHAPIRIGVLHALTGTMAGSEAPLVDALSLAVGEINDAGGLLGRRLEIVLADTRSDDALAAAEAERLIDREQVSALFGCWTSSCRKAVRQVVEARQHLLVYAVQYEGLEQSPHILYTGAAPNQQIIPGTLWAMRNLGRRFALVGSDYVFPRTANLIVRDLAHASGGEIVGEHYRPLGHTDWQAVADALSVNRPEVIINTVNGDSNGPFFAALEHAGLSQVPVLSFSVDENSLQHLGLAEWPGGHYAAWGYFETVAGDENARLLAAFHQRFGEGRRFSDPMHASYNGLRLWAAAVTDVGAPEPREVLSALGRQSVTGAMGIFAVDKQTLHVWRPVLIGRVGNGRQFEVIYRSSDLQRPVPVPSYRSLPQWQIKLRTLETPAP